MRSRRRLDFAGASVLITGGARGLGLALARQLARLGARLVLLARSEEELRAAKRELSPQTDVLTLACDVADRPAVALAINEALTRMGGIDVLVNNASIIQIGPLEALSYEDFRDAMEVNFWGTVHATMAMVPHFRAQGRGRICNITSIGGKVAVPHLLPYDCAKFAAVGFSEGLRAELAKDHIYVTTVVPGLMRTGSAENALFRGRREREYAWFGAGSATPLSAMSAERAARRIVQAIRWGETEVTLSWQAKLLRLAHALAPVLVIELLGLVNRLLPSAGPWKPARPGRELAGRSRIVRSLLARSALRMRELS